MAKQSERKFGAIPEWAIAGPVNGKNYPYRAEAHCAAKSEERKGLHPTITREGGDFRLWLEYFDQHLRKRPVAFQMLIDGDIAEMSVPAARPMWFDGTFLPDPKFVPITSCDPNLDAAREARWREATALKAVRE